MNDKVIRSPFFYVGDKFKLIQEIKTYFPENISRFIEPFVGGGTVFLNVKAKEYLLNDIDSNLIALHLYLTNSSSQREDFFIKAKEIIDKYGLSFSHIGNFIPDELKKRYKKTYFAQYNKEAYIKMRNDYNKATLKENIILYLLLIYGFNRMLRFNKKGEFNLPVGNVDFNTNVFNALNDYFDNILIKHPNWYNSDFRSFLKGISFKNNDFIYLDPPYLITFSEYNKLWSEEDEISLLQILDELNKKNIKFAISNVINYKGRTNSIFLDWSHKYNIHDISSNYISYHDNSIKDFREVLVTNY